MSGTDLALMSACELAERVRSKQVSPVAERWFSIRALRLFWALCSMLCAREHGAEGLRR
jgi:hypothetical protein